VADETTADDWEQHWSDYADTASENPAQAYRRDLVLSLLAAKPGDHVLDVGSGQGDMAAELLRSCPGVSVVGVELSAAGVEHARGNVPGGRFEQINLLTGQPPPDDLRQWAGLAVCSEVLEHVDDPARLLRGVSPYLAPGARLVVTVPGGPRTAFDRHIGHRRHFNVGSLHSTLRDGGFEVERLDAAGFPFFNLYRLVVFVRGRKLVDDVRAGPESLSPTARRVMGLFRTLFRFNLPRSPFGWQLVAVARKPEALSR
jgi:SAM-dependent methyltransferase